MSFRQFGGRTQYEKSRDLKVKNLVAETIFATTLKTDNFEVDEITNPLALQSVTIKNRFNETSLAAADVASKYQLQIANQPSSEITSNPSGAGVSAIRLVNYNFDGSVQTSSAAIALEENADRDKLLNFYLEDFGTGLDQPENKLVSFRYKFSQDQYQVEFNNLLKLYNFTPGVVSPSPSEAGFIAYNTSTGAVSVWTGGSWVDLATNTVAPQYTFEASYNDLDLNDADNHYHLILKNVGVGANGGVSAIKFENHRGSDNAVVNKSAISLEQSVTSGDNYMHFYLDDDPNTPSSAMDIPGNRVLSLKYSQIEGRFQLNLNGLMRLNTVDLETIAVDYVGQPIGEIRGLLGYDATSQNVVIYTGSASGSGSGLPLWYRALKYAPTEAATIETEFSERTIDDVNDHYNLILSNVPSSDTGNGSSGDGAGFSGVKFVAYNTNGVMDVASSAISLEGSLGTDDRHMRFYFNDNTNAMIEPMGEDNVMMEFKYHSAYDKSEVRLNRFLKLNEFVSESSAVAPDPTEVGYIGYNREIRSVSVWTGEVSAGGRGWQNLVTLSAQNTFRSTYSDSALNDASDNYNIIMENIPLNDTGTDNSGGVTAIKFVNKNNAEPAVQVSSAAIALEEISSDKYLNFYLEKGASGLGSTNKLFSLRYVDERDQSEAVFNVPIKLLNFSESHVTPSMTEQGLLAYDVGSKTVAVWTGSQWENLLTNTSKVQYVFENQYTDASLNDADNHYNIILVNEPLFDTGTDNSGGVSAMKFLNKNTDEEAVNAAAIALEERNGNKLLNFYLQGNEGSERLTERSLVFGVKYNTLRDQYELEMNNLIKLLNFNETDYPGLDMSDRGLIGFSLNREKFAVWNGVEWEKLVVGNDTTKFSFVTEYQDTSLNDPSGNYNVILRNDLTGVSAEDMVDPSGGVAAMKFETIDACGNKMSAAAISLENSMLEVTISGGGVYEKPLSHMKVYLEKDIHADEEGEPEGTRIMTQNDLILNMARDMSLNKFCIGVNIGDEDFDPSFNYVVDICGTMRVQGDLLITQNHSFVSDVRYKDGIEPIRDALDIVESLRGVSYRNIINKSESMLGVKSKNYGFIAQEVGRVLPELIFKDSKGFYGVNYIGMISILSEAIKELSRKVDNKADNNNKAGDGDDGDDGDDGFVYEEIVEERTILEIIFDEKTERYVQVERTVEERRKKLVEDVVDLYDVNGNIIGKHKVPRRRQLSPKPNPKA
jgi:hypothetical protein